MICTPIFKSRVVSDRVPPPELGAPAQAARCRPWRGVLPPLVHQTVRPGAHALYRPAVSGAYFHRGADAFAGFGQPGHGGGPLPPGGADGAHGHPGIVPVARHYQTPPPAKGLLLPTAQGGYQPGQPNLGAGHALNCMARGFAYLTVLDVASRRMLALKLAIPLDACRAREVIERTYLRFGLHEIVYTDRPQSSVAVVDGVFDAFIEKPDALLSDVRSQHAQQSNRGASASVNFGIERNQLRRKRRPGCHRIDLAQKAISPRHRPLARVLQIRKATLSCIHPFNNHCTDSHRTMINSIHWPANKSVCPQE